MDFTAEQISALVKKVIANIDTNENAVSENAAGEVPVGVSNRHIHLSKADLEALFGEGYELTPFKDLSQPGQYACKEQLTIIGPSLRPIENVRVLGPVRTLVKN